MSANDKLRAMAAGLPKSKNSDPAKTGDNADCSIDPEALVPTAEAMLRHVNAVAKCLSVILGSPVNAERDLTKALAPLVFGGFVVDGGLSKKFGGTDADVRWTCQPILELQTLAGSAIAFLRNKDRLDAIRKNVTPPPWQDSEQGGKDVILGNQPDPADDNVIDF